MERCKFRAIPCTPGPIAPPPGLRPRRRSSSIVPPHLPGIRSVGFPAPGGHFSALRGHSPGPRHPVPTLCRLSPLARCPACLLHEPALRGHSGLPARFACTLHPSGGRWHRGMSHCEARRAALWHPDDSLAMTMASGPVRGSQTFTRILLGIGEIWALGRGASPGRCQKDAPLPQG